MHSPFNSQILSEQCTVPLILNLRYYLNNVQKLSIQLFFWVKIINQFFIVVSVISPGESIRCTEPFFTALFLGQYYKPVSMRLLYILVLHCLVVFPGESLNITHNESFKGFKVSGFAGFSSCWGPKNMETTAFTDLEGWAIFCGTSIYLKVKEHEKAYFITFQTNVKRLGSAIPSKPS